MKESDIQHLLIVSSELIEEGLTFKEREVYLNGKRCDLLFLDRFGKELYIEVKLKVTDQAVGQLIRYDGLVNNPEARFMLVGVSFADGLKEGLTKNGYEYLQLPKQIIETAKRAARVETELEQISGEMSQVFNVMNKLKQQIDELRHHQDRSEQRFNFLLHEYCRHREGVCRNGLINVKQCIHG